MLNYKHVEIILQGHLRSSTIMPIIDGDRAYTTSC